MIVISGISSAIGIHTANLLAKKGYLVKGFARNVANIRPYLNHPSIQLVSGDLLDTSFVRSICSGADGIIHLAALSSPWGKYSDFYSVNVLGTRSIVETAKLHQVNRVIHVSTPSLYFDFQDRFHISEDDPLPEKGVNAYAITKKMAEDEIDAFVQEGGAAITLRPRAIFGPYDKTLLPRVIKACKEKGILKFKRKSPIVDLTYVENLASALCLALEAPNTCVGEKYNITNGEPTALWSILSHFLENLSIPIRYKYIPYPLAYAAALLEEYKSIITKREPILTRYSLGVLSFSQTLSIEKAKKELNYTPIIPLKTGIERYVNWIQTS